MKLARRQPSPHNLAWGRAKHPAEGAREVRGVGKTGGVGGLRNRVACGDRHMQVLFVLFGSLLVFRLLGVVGVPAFATWLSSARVALASMFVFTAISHFAPMKKDLVAMVPPGLPRPALLVLATGVAELAGALGLLFHATTLWAACGLMALMALMFPANISAARRGTPIRGRRATALWMRAPMQLLFIAWAWMVR